MKHLAIITALVGGLITVAPNAQARVNVDIGIGIPGAVYAEPAPVYVAPQPVYVAPQPVYVAPQPVYVAPRPVVVAPTPVYAPYWRGRDYYDDDDRGGRKWRGHGHGKHGHHRDDD